MTIKEIMERGGRDAILAMGSNFMLGEVVEIEMDPIVGATSELTYTVLITDPATKLHVPLVWTNGDDNKNNMEGRVAIAKSLIENGVHSLQFLIEYKTKGYLE